MRYKKSKELFVKGSKHMVGAVNSPVRAFNTVGGNPIFIEKGKGAYLTDVDGNKYVDYVLSYGPMLLGHANEQVKTEVKLALEDSFSFGASTEKEIELAELICSAFPNMDKVRMVNSGTEAVMSAIRLARAYTGKNQIIKFAGCYHGHADMLLVAAGSGLVTGSLPGSKGVPKDTVSNTLIANFNDIESVKKIISNNNNIAGIIVEPVAGNMGCVLPKDDFLVELRKIASENGILLIIDEVMTGFRDSFGGAQKAFGVEADITCLGKVIGGGFPVGAYGAREEIMQMVAPLGDMYQAGTLSGNPIAMTAGISMLKQLKEENVYEKTNQYVNKLSNFMLDSAKKHHIDITVNTFGSMITPFFTSQPVTNFDEAKASDQTKFTKFFWSLMNNGIYIAPSPFEAWFVSSKHGNKELDLTYKAIDKAFSGLS
ncbi:MAG TPA: glutamate-1-semialdehyde-2,1-aminomutase [Crocinitomix sp.]|nr:glutamate-1-semialdehyde-2,1-aminomutase [Crocinitomix sp.]